MHPLFTLFSSSKNPFINSTHKTLTLVSRLSLRKTSMGILVFTLMVGCIPKEDPQTTTNEITTPRMTMDLPITLSGILSVETTETAQKTTLDLQQTLNNRTATTDPDSCEEYFDSDANFMENGYNMTRFLVGLSQQQSCFADFIMESVVIMGKDWVNKGLISLPIDENDPEAPSHAQIEQTDDNVQVWLFFGTSGDDLPVDRSNTQTLYLNWTTIGADTEGQFFMTNLPVNPDDPDAPEGLRVDFSRTAFTAENRIFLKLRDSHSAGMGGFRIDVMETGSGSSATYTAKGLINFTNQPFNNMPDGLDSPDFSTAAVVDADGLGASIANFNKFGISLENDNNQDGTIDTSLNEFDLGTYQFTISDKTYFSPHLYDAENTEIPYVEQVTQWRNKTVNNAIYVSENQRTIPNPTSTISMINCLEGDIICDYNNNQILDTDIGEWMGWNLGVGYFTDTCMDDASQTSNCDAFVNGFFSQGQFGSSTLNSTDAEPSTDWRNTGLNDLNQLTSVHPDDDTTGATTFNVPETPVR